MPLPDEQLVPQCIDRIFERADTNPYMSQPDPNQVSWRFEDRRITLSRFPQEGRYLLEASEADPELVIADLYLFDNLGVIKAINAFGTAADAVDAEAFFLDAVRSPLNEGEATDDDMKNLFSFLVSGLVDPS